VLASRAYAVLALSLFACSSHEEREGAIDATSSALSDSDPVTTAVDESCTTASVKGLSTQLVEEIQCLRPGTMKSIEGVDGLALGGAVFPWLQAKAADAVIAAQKARGVTLEINSALRTLPQQYLLYRWYKSGRCDIGLAASPGQSNHESGLAIDVQDNAAWQKTMSEHDMKWLGASDPVHFDYVGEGRVDLGGLSVLAFQKLWNLNHPEDPIAEDSSYGDDTEKRLALAPVGGFPKGADCTTKEPEPPVAAPPASGTSDATNKTSGARSNANGGDGCALTARAPTNDGAAPAALLFALALFAFSRRGSGGSALRRADRRRTR
jgi:hypothetical protein